MTVLAEIVEQGIRYRLYADVWDTGNAIRDCEDCMPSVSEVLKWEDYWGWRSLYVRDGATHVENPKTATHAVTRSGYSQGDLVMIIHDGAASEAEFDLVHRICFDGFAYAVSERWTDTGFEMIDSISGLLMGEEPETVLRAAMTDYLGV